MAAPDHWLTLSLLGRSKQWNRSKVFRISLVTSIGHVLISIILGIGVAAIGIIFSAIISDYLDIAIGTVMVVIGLIVGIRPLVTRNQGHLHENHGHTHGHDHAQTAAAKKKKMSDSIGYFAVLGAALSPDPSIAPIFLAAVPIGFEFLLELAILFAVTSIATLIILVELGHRGFTKALERIPEKYNDSIVGFVIAAIGAFILIEAY